MIDVIFAIKDEKNQRPIPTEWRGPFKKMVDLIRVNRFEEFPLIEGVSPVPFEISSAITKNIKNYGVALAELPEESWLTSACQWMEGYWDAMIDLFSIEEGASDLVLSVRVYENNKSYSYHLQSVHVP
ncbi:hypothetical protein LJR039_006021 [Pseudorhodoferax sp. LjRoot39]|uniref:DUF7668 domain-containing protein n=1 Tax=Pseudorhodoferax sp. LjRoot39 TaxID=3342328 RepID=UPI003ECE9FE9